MKSKLTFLLGLVTIAAMVSCYPPTEPQRPVATNTATDTLDEKKETPTVDPTDAGVSEAARDELNAVNQDAGITPTTPSTTPKPKPKPSTGTITETLPDLPSTTAPDTSSVVPKVTTKPVSYPYATSVPNKPGFVFNPYSQAKVDVRGLPSGTLVSDPRDATQKFYVP